MRVATRKADMPETIAREARTSGLRSFVVSIGPSMVLDGLVAASTIATLTKIARRVAGRRGAGVPAITALGAAAPWVYLLTVRPWLLHWGATPAEVTARLPGDDIVP